MRYSHCTLSFCRGKALELFRNVVHVNILYFIVTFFAQDSAGNGEEQELQEEQRCDLTARLQREKLAPFLFYHHVQTTSTVNQQDIAEYYPSSQAVPISHSPPSLAAQTLLKQIFSYKSLFTNSQYDLSCSRCTLCIDIVIKQEEGGVGGYGVLRRIDE